jgi:hypothetical protein
MRYQRKRFTRPVQEQAVRRFEDGREVCLANDVGRAEYQRRKQLLWAEQSGNCDHCTERMALDDTRMTNGAWEGLLRDDRMVNGKGEKNRLVHKACLRAWHIARSANALSSAN